MKLENVPIIHSTTLPPVVKHDYCSSHTADVDVYVARLVCYSHSKKSKAQLVCQSLEFSLNIVTYMIAFTMKIYYLKRKRN